MLRYCVLAELPLSNAEQPTVTCELMGGLGNQLSILFATLSYAMKHQLEFRLPHYQGMLGLDGSSRPAYWDTLLSGLQAYLLDDHELEGVQPQILHEKNEFVYHPLPPPSGSDRWISLRGYFQHPLYAEPHFQAILDLLNLPLDRYAEAAKGCVSMHFRLGDYKNVAAFNLLPAQYYEDALRSIMSRTRVRTVKYAMQEKESDREDVARMLDHLRGQFPGLALERLDPGMQDWEQLLFMARCDHNIIANSTFSWWAARLNPRAARVVAYPHPWFPGIRMAPPEMSGSWNAIPVDV
jgi:hypothetical protein